MKLPTRLALVCLLVLTACGGRPDLLRHATLTQGDPQRGRELIPRYGCHSCHVIPGIPGGDSSLVGPPLVAWAERQYIAGSLLNTPENLVAWIRDPQAVEPGTVMPDAGLNDQDAWDIAAYLYTLDRSDLSVFGGFR